MFGIADIKLESNDINTPKEFKTFLLSFSKRNNLNCILKKITTKQLNILPKPVVLFTKNPSELLALLDIVTFGENNTSYQVFWGRSTVPTLLNEKDLEGIWSGEALYFDSANHRDINYKSGKLLLQFNKAVHNFGVVESSQVQTTVRIVNVGKTAVVVKQPISSCTCTISQIKGNNILGPMETKELLISVSIDKGSKGFRQSIIIPLEDMAKKEKHQFKLEVIGNSIVLLPSAVPEKLNFVDVKIGQIKTQTVAITESPFAKIGNFEITSSNPAIMPVIVESRFFNNKQTYIVEVTLDSNQLEKGKQYDETVLLKNDVVKHKSFSIPLHISTAPQIRVFPSIISWGMPCRNKQLSTGISLISPYGEDISIKEIKTPDNVAVLVKDKTTELTLTVTAKFIKPGRSEDFLKIYFNTPVGAEVVIPIYSYFEDQAKP